jgi:TonB family protein
MFALIFLLSAFFPALAQTGEQQPAPSPSPAAAASPATPEDSTELVVLEAPQPGYPMEAVSKGVQGKVWIHLIISETGDVESTDVLSGDPDLARAAQDAMKKWKFKPYIRNGKPVKVNTKMPVDFALKNKIADASAPPDSSGERPGGNLPRRLQISSGVARAFLQHQVDPIYPIEAQRDHIQGDVIFQAMIGTDGLVHNLKAVTGDPILIEAAKAAVEQWRYRPYILNGSPIEVETTIKVQFRR